MSDVAAETYKCMHCYRPIEPTPPGCPSKWRGVLELEVSCFDRVPHRVMPDVELDVTDV